MAFTVNMREATAGTKSGPVYELADESGSCYAEVWPFLGFNCLRWKVRRSNGELGDLLYAAPDWETNPVPTRSGHPVLFPFPNRLSRGQLNFRGKTYQLPLTESSGQHAIHGFTPRNAWRVLSTFTEPDCCGVIGQFRLSQDFPEALNYWPGDALLTLTYTLSMNSLTVEAEIDNTSGIPLPFGLGYHAYFCLPDAPGLLADEMCLKVPAGQYYEAKDGIPSGVIKPVETDFDFREPQPIGAQQLDRLFTGLPLEGVPADVLTEVAELSHPDHSGRLKVLVSPSFRELLLFTPPHRQAVAIEPYTCASDAATLAERGLDVGWMVLPPESSWCNTVRYEWNS
jgi:aldose 1-epimerase